MLIQDKIAWDADVDRKLAHLATHGVDCVAMELPDPLPKDSSIDVSTPDAATTFFRQARAKVAEHGMTLKTVLATSGFHDIKKGTPGRDEKIALLQNAVQGMST